MKIALAKAYHGLHKRYKKSLRDLGVKTVYFDIDRADWLDFLPKADAYFWHSDAKDENYREILDRVYFLDYILEKRLFPNMNMYFAYNDKIKQNDIFKLHKIPTPKTYITYKHQKALALLKKISYPFVLKSAYSYGGKAVFKIDNKTEALRVIKKIFLSPGWFHGIKDYFLAQEFIGLDRDLRIVTVGNKVVTAHWRINEKDWRHNVARGGTISFENVPESASRLCLKISQKLKFHWMAYDLLYFKGKPLVLEMACNFSTLGPRKLGVDVRGEMMRYLVNYLEK